MASIQRKGDGWYCQFVFRGKRHTFAVGKVREGEAQAVAAKVGYLLMRVRQRLIEVPPGTDILAFIRCDGKPPAGPADAAGPQAMSLADLRDAYLTSVGGGAIEANTLSTVRTHLTHLAGTLGKTFAVDALRLADLQRHVDRRQKAVAGVTIKKEIDTLRGAWNWAARMGHVRGVFPPGKLVYRKADEKPPFMTWAEVERRVKAGGDAALWECLYLSSAEMDELLTFMRTARGPTWLYPMFCLACHTGMRRSELVRARAEDVDVAAGVITVREKKRTRGTRTTRRVPLTDSLSGVLAAWTEARPAATFLLGKGAKEVCLQVTHELFRRAVDGSKWGVLHGFHTLRHSFISACASRGTDQRFIDEWVGHQTEEQRRRYRHLLPSTQKAALQLVFGG